MHRRLFSLILAVAAVVLMASPAHADRIRIPAIHVNAPIAAVGVEHGVLAVGPNLWTVYRWKDGVRPCQLGRFTLAGHTYEGGAAVFNRLAALRRGDRIHMSRPGRACTYLVTSSRLQKASVSVKSCHSFDGMRSTGCLITCVGRIGPGEYTHRRVIRFRMAQRKG